jgi:hypothetical protein
MKASPPEFEPANDPLLKGTYAKMLLSLNKQLLSPDTLGEQSAITSSSLKVFYPRKLWPILPEAG